MNRLTILGDGKRNKWNQKTFKCLCSCGTMKDIFTASITSGRVKSCGCLNKEKREARFSKMIKKHGFCGTRFYRIWMAVNERCNRVKASNYSYYGGRGIKCLWLTFPEFKKDMHRSYSLHVKKHGEKYTTLDRINVDDHYSKSNCKWSTWKEQRDNQRQK